MAPLTSRHPGSDDQQEQQLSEEQRRELTEGADPPRKKIRQFDV